MKFACLALMLLTAAPALAQDTQQQERRGFIGLGIGPSKPSGNFADQSLTQLPGDGATSGYISSFVNLGYRMRTHLGVAAVLSYSQYSMLKGDENDWWQVSGLVIGPMYTLHLGKRGAVDLKAMFGKVRVEAIVDNYGTNYVKSTGLGTDLRVAIRYDVLRRLAVFAEGGVAASGVNFAAGGNGSYRALNSGFGLAYRPMW